MTVALTGHSKVAWRDRGWGEASVSTKVAEMARLMAGRKAGGKVYWSAEQLVGLRASHMVAETAVKTVVPRAAYLDVIMVVERAYV